MTLKAFLVIQWRHIGIYVFASLAYIPIELRKISDYIWVDCVSPLSSARALTVPTFVAFAITSLNNMFGPSSVNHFLW